MNYIGSKVTLLPFIDSTLRELVGDKIDSLTDLFAGTGAVGTHFKSKGVQIIANDIQYYSYVINRHLIGNCEKLDFSGLKQLLPAQERHLFGDESMSNNISLYLSHIEGEEGYIYRNYSLAGTKYSDESRMYFSDYNAKICDAIRSTIQCWYDKGYITEAEYYYLLASLLESIDRYANTASVYGAFLKQLKQSATRPFTFSFMPIVSSDRSNQVFNLDANALIDDLEGEVLYLDPPYNHRQYGANYHILETIARNDNPQIKGKTGLRDYSDQRSKYCYSKEAKSCFEDLIEKARYKYIVLSYNNEGIISIDDIEKIMRRKGEYSVAKKKYGRYKADIGREYKEDHTYEYLHCVKVR